MSPTLKRVMTAAAFQCLGFSDDMKERLNRLVIGVATMVEDHFIKRGSRLSSPADLLGSRFCSSFRTSAIWISGEGEMGRLGRGAAGGPALLAEVGVARRKAWPGGRHGQPLRNAC